MAIFNKKKSDDKESVKDFPDFPSTFAPELKFPEFPGSNEDFNPFKEPAPQNPPREMPRMAESKSPYEDLLDRPLTPQPLQQNQFSTPKSMDPPQMPRAPMYRQPAEQQPSMDRMFNQRPIIPMGPQPQENNVRSFREDKPLFVKIEDYEEAIYTLDKIKAKIKEADKILDELDKIRSEEERQLEEWKRDLETVKDKLLMIDKQLFENS